MYYAVLNDDSFQEFNDKSMAVEVAPEFIIGLNHRGTYDRTFPERRVIHEHYHIKFFSADGTDYKFERNGWKILNIEDPVRYYCHILVTISDPTGSKRIFDKWNTVCHYQMYFTNRVDNCDGLIRLFRFFHELSKFDTWKNLERQIFLEEKSFSPLNLDRTTGVGELHPYFKE